MKTTMEEILKRALIGKYIRFNGEGEFTKILDADSNGRWANDEGEIRLTLEGHPRNVNVWLEDEIELRDEDKGEITDGARTTE
jgi:hypothetical protein